MTLTGCLLLAYCIGNPACGSNSKLSGSLSIVYFVLPNKEDELPIQNWKGVCEEDIVKAYETFLIIC